MATDVLIPKLGMTMTEGTLAEWMIPDGAEVKAGQILYHLETEKIEFDVEAESDGTVAHLVPAGTTLPPGALVGYVLDHVGRIDEVQLAAHEWKAFGTTRNQMSRLSEFHEQLACEHQFHQ